MKKVAHIAAAGNLRCCCFIGLSLNFRIKCNPDWVEHEYLKSACVIIREKFAVEQ